MTPTSSPGWFYFGKWGIVCFAVGGLVEYGMIKTGFYPHLADAEAKRWAKQAELEKEKSGLGKSGLEKSKETK